MIIHGPNTFHLEFEAVECFCFAETEKGEPLLVMLQKRKEHKYYPGLWGIPAGRIEPGESPLDAIIREVSEETGNHFSQEAFELVLKTNHLHYFKNDDDEKDLCFRLFTFICKEKLTKIILDEREHSDYLKVSEKNILEADMGIFIPDTVVIYNILRKEGMF